MSQIQEKSIYVKTKTKEMHMNHKTHKIQFFLNFFS